MPRSRPHVLARSTATRGECLVCGSTGPDVMRREIASGDFLESCAECADQRRRVRGQETAGKPPETLPEGWA